MKVQAIRGMRDLFGPEMAEWWAAEKIIREIFENFGYGEIRLPVLEKAEVFSQAVGEDSDIVEKQMYCFLDQNQEKIALRPEGTASFIRAVIEHQLHKQNQPLRFFYMLPMFRYERPQKGRERQFNQFGAELVNDPTPQGDAELIVLLDQIYKKFGIQEYEIRINSVGSEKSRPQYREALKSFFKDKLSTLCAQCQKRFERAPMRILDCKNETCQKLAEGAPLILDYLDSESKAQHEGVMRSLDAAGVKYIVDPKIVRGLDYYSQTAFEFVSSLLGAQSALGAGGRYDGLATRFGEKPIPAVGFAAGMERLMIALTERNLKPKIETTPVYFFAPLGEQAFEKLFPIQFNLKRNGVSVAMFYESNRSLKSLMKHSDKCQAKFTLVLGEEELKSGKAMLRTMKTGQQEEIELKDLESQLKRRALEV